MPKHRDYDYDTSSDDEFNSDGFVNMKSTRPHRQSSQAKRFKTNEEHIFSDEESSADDSFEDKSYSPQRKNPKKKHDHVSYTKSFDSPSRIRPKKCDTPHTPSLRAKKNAKRPQKTQNQKTQLMSSGVASAAGRIEYIRPNFDEQFKS